MMLRGEIVATTLVNFKPAASNNWLYSASLRSRPKNVQDVLQHIQVIAARYSFKRVATKGGGNFGLF